MKWISVEEEMPELGEVVLAYSLTDGIGIAIAYSDIDGPKMRWFYNEIVGGGWFHITHWMRLPSIEPPDEYK